MLTAQRLLVVVLAEWLRLLSASEAPKVMVSILVRWPHPSIDPPPGPQCRATIALLPKVPRVPGLPKEAAVSLDPRG